MIPGSFEYHRPANLSEAVALLGRLDSDARVIAGGHSLIPMMKLRLAMPSHLIDLAGVAELKGVRLEGGEIVIGAMTTQHEIIGSELLAQHAPILRETAEVIADPQVRYVGTIGGNVANGDPGNDMPALMMTLGATYVLARRGRRAPRCRARLLPLALRNGRRARRGARRHPRSRAPRRSRLGVREAQAQGRRLRDRRRGGDPDRLGRQNRDLRDRPHQCRRNGAASPPTRRPSVIGTALDKPTLARAAAAATAIAEPAADGRGSAEYRAKMAGVMTARALTRAFARAKS